MGQKVEGKGVVIWRMSKSCKPSFGRDGKHLQSTTGCLGNGVRVKEGGSGEGSRGGGTMPGPMGKPTHPPFHSFLGNQ